MSKRLHLRAVLAVTYLLVAAAVVVAFVFSMVALGGGNWRVAPVVTGSMGHAIPTGSVVAVERVPTASLKVGDVIVFQPPIDDPGLRVHRIIQVDSPYPELKVTTKGDANPVQDSWSPMTVTGQDAWRVRWSVAKVGTAITWLQVPANKMKMFGALVLGAAVFLLWPVWAPVLRRRPPAVGDDPARHEPHDTTDAR